MSRLVIFSSPSAPSRHAPPQLHVFSSGPWLAGVLCPCHHFFTFSSTDLIWFGGIAAHAQSYRTARIDIE
jgi:hypothetical protein